MKTPVRFVDEAHVLSVRQRTQVRIHVQAFSNLLGDDTYTVTVPPEAFWEIIPDLRLRASMMATAGESGLWLRGRWLQGRLERYDAPSKGTMRGKIVHETWHTVQARHDTRQLVLTEAEAQKAAISDVGNGYEGEPELVAAIYKDELTYQVRQYVHPDLTHKLVDYLFDQHCALPTWVRQGL